MRFPRPSETSATPVSADRNLLFGILALQNGFVTRDGLVAGMNDWVLAKHRPLADVLAERGLRADHRALLDALVHANLDLNVGDAEKSLAALSSLGPDRQELARIADPDVQASLSVVGRARPAVDDPYATGAPAAGASTSGGLRFRILRPHAEGGPGRVSVAFDGELNREVALKEIKNNLADDPGHRAKFLLEAEVTGGLEHPGIVPVYGLGTYGDGRPFYAMRFIKGDSLKEALERFHGPASRERERPEGAVPPVAHALGSPRYESLEFRQLLGRFIDICQAVAYAHSRGVLHRDLKPDNVMLGKYGETLLVDWGLAKPLGDKKDLASRERQRPEELPLMPSSASGSGETLPGSVVGTPAFMSPEQAAGRTAEIGTASDVYGLGAILYAVLTGRPPVMGTVVEVLDKVTHGEITPPRQVQPAVPAALAAVCLKAMALKPGDRYSTAQDLAAEIEHFLADEPVTAWREPAGVRLRRWVRKHARLVTGVAAALAVGAVTLGVAAVLLTAANTREREAASRERDAKETALAREAETKAVLEFVENKIFAAARPEGQYGGLGHDVLLRDAVRAALPFVDQSFRDRPLIEARLRMTLGVSYSYLGDAKTAAEQYQAACSLDTSTLGPDHPDTLRTMNNLANSYFALGRPTDGLKLIEEALAVRKAKLGPDHPDTLLSMANLASSLVEVNRGSEALPLIDDFLKRTAGKTIDPRLVPLGIDLRLRHFAKVKDAAGCRTTAEIWERLNRSDAGSLYNAACYRAVTAGVAGQTPEADAARHAGEDADRAMDWLRKSLAAGYRDIPDILKDADLDPLRGRADFAELLWNLAEAGPPKPP